ncbi:MAG TPA: Uma2 family endonuclease [Bryobacteraceae bacterium]|nr:Uma2 family endonuclease [Bryobacteraceae bacterium]
MASNPVSKLTEEEYLAIERAAELRSEFVDGEMFAMSGGTNRHGRIQRNLIGELYMGLRSGACEPFGSDSRVKVSSRAYVYPDVTVVCGERAAIEEDDDILTDPVAVFEVLSPSTEKYDRGLKFQLYRSIDSVKDYVLVNQEQVRIEQFTRQPDGTWILHDYLGRDETLTIDSIGVAIPLQRIYDKVATPPDTN